MRATQPSMVPTSDDVAGGRSKILLVDDQPARLLTYEAMLEGLDVQCVRAGSGRAALEHLLAESFAVIILDVSMPEMDGFETARAIREHPRFEHTPIIFVTGVNISHFDALKGYEVGAIDYLPVPVIPTILRSKVSWLAQMHRRQAELERLNGELQRRRRTLEQDKRRLLASSQEQLRESEHRYRAIFEIPTQLTVVVEPIYGDDGDILDWRCCDANTHIASLLGLAREDLIGSKLTEVLPDRATRLIPLWAAVLRGATLHSYEARMKDLDFLIQLFPIDGNTLVCTGVDITARIAAEREARRLSEADRAEKEWLAAVLHDMTDEVYFADSQERYTYANPAALRALQVDSLDGVAVRELAERLHIHRADGTPRPIEESPALRALKGETVREEETLVWVASDGQWSYRQVSCAPVRDRNGAIIGAVSVIRDTTERRRSQEALRLSEQQLREADQRKDEFIAMLAHELRNPMVPIRTGIELLKRKGNDPIAVAQLQPMMERQIGHMTRLIDDLLDISRITSGKIGLKPDWVTLSMLVNGAVDAARVSIQSNRQELQIDVSDPEVAIEVDPTRITQAISNLLHNAAKFTATGGHIRVCAGIEDTAVGAERSAVIRVCDNGMGIQPGMLARVFELFAQAEQGGDARESGLGIGLAIASKLVQLHGGTIEAHSAGPGQGSEFIIRLPVATAVVTVATPDKPPEMFPPRLRVLVVDDNHDAADSTALLLTTEHVDTRTAYSAHAALEALQHFRAEIILMDIGMAGMNGIEACQRIRALYRDSLRLIAVSGWGQEQDKAKALQAGFDLHLTKPVEPAALYASIKALSQRPAR